ncbi:MAG: GTPase ObgE [Pseudomonadota bacterium]
MFTDRVTITVNSGNGGPGAVAFHREKFVIQGSPSGGSGGRGGSVYFLADPNADSLSPYRGKHHHKAQNGEQGGNRNKTGKSGEDITLVVPPGTQVIDDATNEVLLDLMEVGATTLFLEGGKGGLGNTHFKNSVNQRPTYAQKGIPGITKTVRMELKLIADVGLVGFPNVGKSTLISAISAAKPEVADYEFTTLRPHLGMVELDLKRSFVIADIPGIIEGASDGRGLGLEFLRHIERTRVALFCLDSFKDMPLIEQYNILNNELIKYSELISKRPRAIAITRIDSVGEDVANEMATKLASELGNDSGVRFILPISSVARINLDKLQNLLYESVNEA